MAAMQSDDLFATDDAAMRPLADRMRPASLDGYIGQEHLLGEGKPLRRAIENGRLHSMIFWGPPGTGKTTLARLLAGSSGYVFHTLSAVLAGVKDIRAAVDQAKQTRAQTGHGTVLFIDEVHRFNKSQQDAFLPHVEDGTLLFVGATTENPSFELNNALLSRARVYVLKPLATDAITGLLKRALADEAQGLGKMQLQIDDDKLGMLAEAADGDARRALNLLEIALNAWQVQERLGSPDGELAIAQAVVYLASAAKSNAVYSAYNQAMAAAKASGSLEVPIHLRNAPTRLMKELGYGRAYRYAHDEPGAYAAGETYLPEEMQGQSFYHPVDRGLEIRIGEKLAQLRELDEQAGGSDEA